MRDKQIADDGSSIDRRKFLRAIGAGAGATALASLGGVGAVAGATVDAEVETIGTLDDDVADGPGSTIAIETERVDDVFLEWCFRDPNRCYLGCPDAHEDCDLIEWGPGTSIKVEEDDDKIDVVVGEELEAEFVADQYELAIGHEQVEAVDDLLVQHTLRDRPENMSGYELETGHGDLEGQDPVVVNVPYDGYGISMLSVVVADDDHGERTAVHAVGRTIETVEEELVENVYVTRPEGEIYHYEDDVSFDDEVDKPLADGWRRHRDPYTGDEDLEEYCEDFPWIDCPDDDETEPIELCEIGLTADVH